jgi:hypothetical protein
MALAHRRERLLYPPGAARSLCTRDLACASASRTAAGTSASAQGRRARSGRSARRCARRRWPPDGPPCSSADGCRGSSSSAHPAPRCASRCLRLLASWPSEVAGSAVVARTAGHAPARRAAPIMRTPSSLSTAGWFGAARRRSAVVRLARPSGGRGRLEACSARRMASRRPQPVTVFTLPSLRARVAGANCSACLPPQQRLRRLTP